jgi:predicted amino acid-binding ACT domain protein
MDTIRKLDYFSMETAHKVGEGARLLGALRVNLLAFTGFPSGRRAQVDFIPADTAQFRQAAKKLKLKLGSRKTVFLAQGDDRPGAIAEICEKLAAAGINMIAMDAVAVENDRYGAIFWVEPRSVNKAAKVLGAV